MKGFIRSLLGVREDSTTFKTPKAVQKTRSALVKEWDSLKREYERLNEADWSIDINTRLVEIQDRLMVVEDSCVASHVIPHKEIMPEDALKMWQGKSLLRALNDNFDDTALLALCAILVKHFNKHYPLLAQEFLDRFGQDIKSMSSNQADSVRETASELIWRFLVAFYEIGMLRALGTPRNVFVSANVRYVFAGLLRKDLIKKGYDDPGRQWAEESLTNFVRGHMRNPEFYFYGKDSHLANVFAMQFAGGIPAVSQAQVELGEGINRMFASFVTPNRAVLDQILDGSISTGPESE